jgi:hypothetical protein
MPFIRREFEHQKFFDNAYTRLKTIKSAKRSQLSSRTTHAFSRPSRLDRDLAALSKPDRTGTEADNHSQSTDQEEGGQTTVLLPSTSRAQRVAQENDARDMRARRRAANKSEETSDGEAGAVELSQGDGELVTINSTHGEDELAVVESDLEKRPMLTRLTRLGDTPRK